VFSPKRKIFRLGEKYFAQAMRYSRPGEKIPYSLDYFGSSDKFFAQARDIFVQVKLV